MRNLSTVITSPFKTLWLGISAYPLLTPLVFVLAAAFIGLAYLIELCTNKETIQYLSLAFTWLGFAVGALGAGFWGEASQRKNVRIKGPKTARNLTNNQLNNVAATFTAFSVLFLAFGSFLILLE